MAIKGLIFLKVSDWNLSYKQSKTTLDFYIRYPRMPYQTDQTKEMILTIHFYPSWCKKGVENFHKHILSTQNEIQDCSRLANQKVEINLFQPVL